MITNQQNLFGLEQSVNPADIVYTPVNVCKQIINHLRPKGVVLDPCKGDGAFFNNLSADTTNKYCEIREGSDFFQFNDKVDWVIGNPPYSIFLEFLQHSFKIADNVSFLVPTNKVFQRQIIMDMVNEWGGYVVKSYTVQVRLLASRLALALATFTFKKAIEVIVIS